MLPIVYNHKLSVFIITICVKTCSFIEIVRFFTPYIGVWGGMRATYMIPEVAKTLIVSVTHGRFWQS